MSSLIDRDWAAFAAQSRLLGLGEPRRAGTDIFVAVCPAGTDDEYLAILSCDGYDATAPLLNFGDPADPADRGGSHWPRMAGAPMNAISYNAVTVPIICTPGTRGYHLHPSHAAESWPASTWRLPKVASLLWWFTHTGQYQGRGL